MYSDLMQKERIQSHRSLHTQGRIYEVRVPAHFLARVIFTVHSGRLERRLRLAAELQFGQPRASFSSDSTRGQNAHGVGCSGCHLVWSDTPPLAHGSSWFRRSDGRVGCQDVPA